MRAFLNAYVWVCRATEARIGGMKDTVLLLTTTGRNGGVQP